MTTTIIRADIDGRRAAALANPQSVPSSNHRDQEFSAQLRSKLVDRDGRKFYQFDGYASTVDQTYQMYDFWGPYDEKIDGNAFDATLAADPDVAFLLNHRGMTMARTKVSKTLELDVDETGLHSRAFCNPERQDVRDMALAIEDGDIDQMSFAFRIVRGQWSPDYTEYTILEVDLDRGDVSAVNYGANPYTSISARAKQVFEGIDHLDGVPLVAAAARINARLAGRAATTARTMDGGSADGSLSEADIEFLTAMIEHHSMALDMATEYLTTSPADRDPRVQSLAGAIVAAQTDEIGSMTEWLTESGVELAAGKAGTSHRSSTGRNAATLRALLELEEERR